MISIIFARLNEFIDQAIAGYETGSKTFPARFYTQGSRHMGLPCSTPAEEDNVPPFLNKIAYCKLPKKTPVQIRHCIQIKSLQWLHEWKLCIFNVMYNPRYLCSLLKQMGLTYQKVAFVFDHLDEEKIKEWQEVTWPQIVKEAKEKNAIILFCDEVSFAQWESLGRTWAPKGNQPKVKTTGKRKGLKMFGAIEFFDGDFYYMETPEKFNGESYAKFLDQLLAQYNRPIILIEDGATYHGGHIVNPLKEKMKNEGRLLTYHLPSYSRDYNPIEKLWKNTKRDATHCKYFPTFEDLRTSVLNAFKQYMEDATKVICVMEKLRADTGIA